MYISELKIHGFKSFAKKSVLKFGEGITAVVGPNGCGKTNIVDAIRWVLGEQKTSVLRGGKMEDVIFNGADGLKPLSMCEVALTVHNNKGKLPLEYNDVEITRRAFRNGESEYFINRIPCRLKDIQDLFMDTGMGADAYSVIELRMIENILSDVTEDRRRMFEEAAGINKYKHQRRSALRKFEATRQDLDRVNDIIREVQSKVQGLALQLKRFKRHAALTEKLRDREISLAYLRSHRYQELTRPLETKIEEYRQLKESKAESQKLYDEELLRHKTAYRERQSELENVQAVITRMESEREEGRNNVLVWTEKARAAEASIERLEQELKRGAEKQQHLLAGIQDLEGKIQVLEADLDTGLQSYQQKKTAFETVESTYRATRQEFDRQQALRWKEQQQVSERAALLNRTEAVLGEKTENLESLESQLRDLEQGQQTEAADHRQLEKRKGELGQALNQQQTHRASLEKQLQQQLQRQQELHLEQQGIRTRIETLTRQRKFLEELLETREGYPAGVRRIMEHREEYPGILGTVGELLQVREEYTAAIENALGSLSHCLVAENRQTALKLITEAARDKLGQVSIIPLAEVSGFKLPLPSRPAAKGVIGPALDFVTTTAELRPLADFLLGNLMIVDDLSQVLETAAGREHDLVDKLGNFSGKSPLLKSHRIPEEPGIMGREQKIEALKQEIVRLESKAVQNTRDLKECSTSIESLQPELDRTVKAVDLVQAGLLDLEKDLIRNQYRRSHSSEAGRNTRREIEDLQKELGRYTATLDDLVRAAEKDQAGLQSLDEQVARAGEKLEEIRQERERFNQEVQELRVKALQLENQHENFLFQKQTARETITELEQRRTHIQEEIRSLREQRSGLDGQVQQGQARLDELNGKLKHQRSILDLKRQAFNEAYQAIEDLEMRIRRAQQERESILEDLNRCEVQIADNKQKIALIGARIRDRYQVEIPEHLVVDQEAEELATEIERLERSIAAIGPVNMAVQVEYEEEAQRLELLESQREDLVQAEENLRESIQKIDQVARQQFLETYQQIKVNFEKLFSLYFEGGRGSLSLTGDPDPLESNISIHAQPPGKPNQSLRMLSAGEKALTAIALLFAIYQVKPSPYCILDEVDAPLDDVNIGKFSRVVRKFSEETQFIVVTHNKLTMEAANYLYGVTMEQKGVSKLVSVKLNA